MQGGETEQETLLQPNLRPVITAHATYARVPSETQADFSAEIVPDVDATVLDDAAIAAFHNRWERKSNRTEIAHGSAVELLENAALTMVGMPTFLAGLNRQQPHGYRCCAAVPRPCDGSRRMSPIVSER